MAASVSLTDFQQYAAGIETRLAAAEQQIRDRVGAVEGQVQANMSNIGSLRGDQAVSQVQVDNAFTELKDKQELRIVAMENKAHTTLEDIKK